MAKGRHEGKPERRRRGERIRGRHRRPSPAPPVCDDPWDQYWTLLRWAGQDRHFVRNVRAEKLVAEPRWHTLSAGEAIRLAAGRRS
jgi:hypothetical protein